MNKYETLIQYNLNNIGIKLKGNTKRKLLFIKTMRKWLSFCGKRPLKQQNSNPMRSNSRDKTTNAGDENYYSNPAFIASATCKVIPFTEVNCSRVAA
jgi:hypothetical protein